MTVGVAVAMMITGSTAGALLFLFTNPITLVLALLGLYAMRTPFYEWYLPRYGITVEAVHRGHRNYAFTDLHGTTRTAAVAGTAPTRRIAYHPDRAGGEPFAAHSWVHKVFRTSFCLAFLVVALSLFALNIYLAVDGFRRG
ncbi:MULTISPECIES: hypothetical protein [unclassified Streptomyces]|uniref:hypothetical protein n=1 Tax=unclassified Streptomyces TaxID=2593676 RepID=UPI00367E1D44